MIDVTEIVPPGDAGLDAYGKTLRETLRTSPERFGVDAARVERHESLTSTWKASYDEAVQTRRMLRGSLAIKNDARSDCRAGSA